MRLLMCDSSPVWQPDCLALATRHRNENRCKHVKMLHTTTQQCREKPANGMYSTQAPLTVVVVKKGGGGGGKHV